jgi:hypothetical protein
LTGETDLNEGSESNDTVGDASSTSETSGDCAAVQNEIVQNETSAQSVVHPNDRNTRDGRADHITGHKRLDFKDAFWLATVGGAQALRMEEQIGNFEVGKQFDALLVRSSHTRECDSVLQAFERFVNLGDDRDVKRVYVRGKCVADKQ